MDVSATLNGVAIGTPVRYVDLYTNRYYCDQPWPEVPYEGGGLPYNYDCYNDLGMITTLGPAGYENYVHNLCVRYVDLRLTYTPPPAGSSQPNFMESQASLLSSQSAAATAPCPSIQFVFPASGQDKHILMHNHRRDDKDSSGKVKYPYPEPNNQSEDGEILVQARVVGASGQGLNGADVWFRLKVPDPQDGASYNPNRAPGDNQGGTARLASGLASVKTKAIDLNMNQVIDSGETGIAETTLQLPGSTSNPGSAPAGGDNFQIEASLDNFASAASLSGTLTVWKRAYIEHTRMYKSGEFLVTNSLSGGTQTILSVRNGKTFRKGDKIHIFSAAEDPNNRAPLVGDRAIVVSAPTTTTVTVQKDANGDGIGDGVGLQLAYNGAGSGDPCIASLPFTFVAKANGSSDYYDVLPNASQTLTELSKGFDDAYLEWKTIDGHFIPAWTNLTSCAATDASRSDFIDARTIWFFGNFDYTSGPRQNHVQVVSAAEFTSDDRFAGQTSAQNVGSGQLASNWSWIFMKSISDTNSKSADQVKVRDNTIAHELGHQWNVNTIVNGDQPVCKPGEDPDCGHDAQNACQSGSAKCLMNQDRNRRLGVVRFHCNATAPSKDLYCIRGHIDDLNQDSCTWR